MAARYRLLLFFLLGFSAISFAQTNILDARISGDYTPSTIIQILQDIERQIEVQFYYDPDKVPYFKVSHEFKDERLYDALEQVFKETLLMFAQYEPGKIIIARKTNFNKEYAEQLIAQWDAGELEAPELSAAKEESLSFGKKSTAASGTLTFSGTLLDVATRDAIIGATLTTKSGEGTATDVFGKFELPLEADEHLIMVRYIGYQPIELTLELYESGEAELLMNTNPLELDEVVIKAAAADANVRSTQMGIETLTPATIKELPSFLGEADVIKSLEMLPGVTSVGEGSAGFNVRGGSIDQNLILQEEAPVFNASHVLGFFSIFNPDAVKNVTLYKGHIPAQYGGRLSSVLDVQLQDGTYDKSTVSGGIGLIASRLQWRTPIKKGKTALLVGARASYSDWLLRRVQLPDARASSAYFYDGIAKLTHRFSEESKLTLSYYRSFDFFRYAQDFGFDWQTQLVNLKWQKIWNDQWSSTTTAVGGDYVSQQFDPEGTDAFELSNGLRYAKFKQHNFYRPNQQHAISLGADITFNDMRPEQLRPNVAGSGIRSLNIEKEQAYEFGVYVSDEWNISPHWAIDVGLRYSGYQHLGPDVVYNYRENTPRIVENLQDSTIYAAGEPIVYYGGFEPRVSLKWQVNEQSAVKWSYNRLQQFIHLISNTAVATPVDVWQLSNPYLPQKIADNFSMGLFRNSDDAMWETSIEGYYRTIDNQLDFKDLATLLLNEQIETEWLNGVGRSYGLEFYGKKNLGRWTGWLSYTYARSETRIDANFDDEVINNGEWFPAYYDQPHQLSFFARCQVLPTQVFTANFTYRSGRPITAPVASYFVGSALIPHYSERNQFRIPAYHRLDLAYTFDNQKAKRRGLKSSLTVAIYNVYFRKNAFSVFFQRDSQNVPQAFQLAILGTALPSVTYNFSF
ncbi:MAG: TonB-dependent receptor [Bacteroidota bacterium]